MKRQKRDAVPEKQKNEEKKAKTELSNPGKHHADPEMKSVKTNKPSSSKSSLPKASWSIPEVLSESFSIPLPACERFASMISEECTLPFIARYRKEEVGNLEIEDLRKMKATVEELEKVQGKMSSIIKTLDAQKLLTKPLLQIICNTKDLDELESHYAPFKESKKTLAARAKELGIEEPALKLLNENKEISIKSLVNRSVEGLQEEANVELGIQHVIAAVIGKDDDNIAKMDTLVKNSQVALKISKSKSTTKPSPDDAAKFENYIGKSFFVKNIKPHMVMIINRGESLKAMSVKVDFPPTIETNWIRHCKEKYSVRGTSNQTRNRIIEASIADAYNRIVEPLFSRRIRSQLTKTAHVASIDSFARNLKNLLLTPPLTDTPVLGLDPGFKHGCKCAVVAAGGTVLHTETIHIPFSAKFSVQQPAVLALKRIIFDFKCYTIALGNGTACRETEQFLSHLIQTGCFSPQNVKYTIVNESGSSIYSCSPEARAEFPNLDPNVISAVSLARRLQDPLTEYVRVSPEHLGIGMYQHDIPVKKLEATLEDVVVECVSFVGVDLNTCPLHVLRKVAGLTEKKAQKIIDHRVAHGPFINRQQLLDVSSLGPKTYEQCVGFLKIIGANSDNDKGTKPSGVTKGKKRLVHSLQPDPLDRTGVHPESYPVAREIIQMFGGEMNEIGHPSFIAQLKGFLSIKSTEEIAKVVGKSVGKVDQILLSLSQSIYYDLRAKFEKPVFKSGITTMADLRVGQQVDGQVSNVTDFGAFIDIGVGKDALLHVSALKGKPLVSLSVGARVTVKILRIQADQQRINLELI